MNIYKVFQDIVLFISEAVGRIFTPNQDEYPVIGVQPFQGDPYDKSLDVD